MGQTACVLYPSPTGGEHPVVGAAGNAVDLVVRAHERRHAALLDGILERRQVRVHKILHRHLGVEVVAREARACFEEGSAWRRREQPL